MMFWKQLMITIVVCLCGIAEAGVYEVGPNRVRTQIGEVPWESLAAGDTVQIH